MNLKIHHRNFDLHNNHQKVIHRQAEKIRKMLPTFASETVELDVGMQKLVRGSQFQTSLTLTLPQRVMRVEEIQDNPITSAVRAFGELRRRVQRFKSQLSREKLWRKQPSIVVSEPASGSSRDLENAINDNLEKVENYVRREVYHYIISGSIPPGTVEPHEIVDDVFLEVTSSAKSCPSKLPLEQWMFQVARNRVRDRLKELEAHRFENHVGDAAEVSDRWEDEDLNFYQPDESLQLEDILKDGQVSSPEELLARDEVEEQLQRGIAALPKDIRESFILFVLEGFTSDEVAMMTGDRPSKVLENVETARQILRKEIKA